MGFLLLEVLNWPDSLRRAWRPPQYFCDFLQCVCAWGGLPAQLLIPALPFPGLCSLLYLHPCISSFLSISTEINKNPDSRKALNLDIPKGLRGQPRQNNYVLDVLGKLHPKKPPAAPTCPRCHLCLCGSPHPVSTTIFSLH